MNADAAREHMIRVKAVEGFVQSKHNEMASLVSGYSSVMQKLFAELSAELALLRQLEHSIITDPEASFTAAFKDLYHELQELRRSYREADSEDNKP